MFSYGYREWLTSLTSSGVCGGARVRTADVRRDSSRVAPRCGGESSSTASSAPGRLERERELVGRRIGAGVCFEAPAARICLDAAVEARVESVRLHRDHLAAGADREGHVDPSAQRGIVLEDVLVALLHASEVAATDLVVDEIGAEIVPGSGRLRRRAWH